jgi:hypothetical protein
MLRAGLTVILAIPRSCGDHQYRGPYGHLLTYYGAARIIPPFGIEDPYAPPDSPRLYTGRGHRGRYPLLPRLQPDL